MNQKNFLLIFTSVFLLAVCTPQSSEEKPNEVARVSLKDLNDYISILQKKPELKTASIGFILLDSANKSLTELNAQQSFAPASVMKLVTTASALEILGNNFRFETTLAYSGKIEAGVLKGDLYIHGGGDPTLGSKKLDELLAQWVSKVSAKGIKKIEGNIIGDASVFDPFLIPRTWVWEDMGNYYGSGACGLNINENLYKLYFKPGKVGDLATVLRTKPKVEGIEFNNQMETGTVGSGDNGYIFGSPFSYQRTLRGSIPAGSSEFSIKGSLPDPALQCAQWFQKALSDKGIKANGAKSIYKKTKASTTAFYTEKSAPLSEIVERTNTKSINIFAEAILKKLGNHLKQEGSTSGGAEALEDFWAKKGIDMKGFFIEDGSGLSRFNGVSAKQIGQILQYVSKKPYFNTFYNSLAVSGQSGTLRRMCRGSIAKGKIHAKSGSMKRVRCYAGFAENLGGQKLPFAIFINNYDGKYSSLTPYLERLMDKMVTLDLKSKE